MSFLRGLFGTKKEKEPEKVVPWQLLTSEEQLDEIAADSSGDLIAVFKHSIRCGISSMILRRFEREYDLELGDVKLYIVDILNHRHISDEVMKRFQVWHESPQLILLRNGKTLAHFSHHQVQADILKAYA